MILSLLASIIAPEVLHSKTTPVFAWASNTGHQVSFWRPGEIEPTRVEHEASFVALRGQRLLSDDELAEEIVGELAAQKVDSVAGVDPSMMWYAEAPATRLALLHLGEDLQVIVRDKDARWREFSIQKLRRAGDPRIIIDGLKYEPEISYNEPYGRWVVRWVEFERGWRSAWFTPDRSQYGMMSGHVMGWIDDDPLVLANSSGLRWRGKRYAVENEDDPENVDRIGFQVGPDIVFAGTKENWYRASSAQGRLMMRREGRITFQRYSARTYSSLPFRLNTPRSPKDER